MVVQAMSSVSSKSAVTTVLTILRIKENSLMVNTTNLLYDDDDDDNDTVDIWFDRQKNLFFRSSVLCTMYVLFVVAHYCTYYCTYNNEQ
jgi:hypothetical protein